MKFIRKVLERIERRRKEASTKKTYGYILEDVLEEFSRNSFAFLVLEGRYRGFESLMRGERFPSPSWTISQRTLIERSLKERPESFCHYEELKELVTYLSALQSDGALMQKLAQEAISGIVSDLRSLQSAYKALRNKRQGEEYAKQ
jgi:hypothetical protein